MKIEKNDCQICGEGHLTFHVEKIPAEFNGVTEDIDSHFALCSICGVQGGADEMRKNKRIMIAFKKRVSGLLTGAQVRQIRNQLGLTQKAANEVFGGGPVAFSKYEADDVIQSESMDKLLRLISAHPYLLENSATTSITQCSIWITMPDPIVNKQQSSRVERRARHTLNAESGWLKIA